MPSGDVLTYSQAAEYCGGVTRQAIYLILKQIGYDPVPVEARVGFGSRQVKGVEKSVLDTLRGQGYLKPRPRKK